MMGRQKGRQPKLFYGNVNIAERVPAKHLLRKIEKALDFDFIYKEVGDSYGANGNVSVPPPVTLKLMLLLVLYNVRSERELMETQVNIGSDQAKQLNSQYNGTQNHCF